MSSGKQRHHRAALGAGAILGLFGAILHFAGCGLSTAGTAEQPTGSLCNTAQDCDDKNACTDDECSTDKFCSNTPKTGGGPDDDNDCTTDACTAGVESHTAEADGTSCKAGVGTGICMTGACIVKCSSDAVCDDKNACTTDSCDLATKNCDHGKLNGPEPGVTPIKGDCKAALCVAGVPQIVDDNTDVPDENDCKKAVCAAGVLTVSNLAAETACGAMAKLKCDGNGTCANCASAMDCTVPNSCQIAACTGGSCIPTFAPVGTAPPDQQMPNDCTKIVCDGSGNADPQPDPTDLPADDGNSCTTEECNSDVPVHDPLPNIGKPCSGGVCNNLANCVQCIADANCPGGKCNPQFQCVQCLTATDCNDGVACTVDACTSQACVHMPMAALCDDMNVCTNDSCNPASGCQHANNTAACATDNNGCTDDICNGGACTHPNNTSACNDGNACTTGDVCSNGSCNGMQMSCGAAPQCKKAGNPTCSGGTCQYVDDDGAACPADGNPCTTDTCSGGACTHPPVSDGTSCGGGTMCVGSTLTSALVCMTGMCKGGSSGACPNGYACLNGTTCQSCSDGMKDGGETDKDCGGGAPCGKCGGGKSCMNNSDCTNGNCKPDNTCN